MGARGGRGGGEPPEPYLHPLLAEQVGLNLTLSETPKTAFLGDGDIMSVSVSVNNQ